MHYNATHNNKEANAILTLYDSYHKLYCQYSILILQQIYLFGTKPLPFLKLKLRHI